MSQLSRTHKDLAGVAPTETPAEAAPEVVTPAARLRRLLAHPYLTLVSRLVLGIVFLLAGMTKVGVPAAFTASINSYEMPLPEVLVQAMAYGLPLLELAVGLWLIVGLFTRLSATICAALMVVFLIALIQAMVRGLDPDCGCFGGASGNALGLAVVKALGPIGTYLTTEKVGPDAVVRDLVFLGMALHLMFVPTVFSIDHWRRRPAEDAADDAE